VNVKGADGGLCRDSAFLICVRHFEPNGTHWNQVGPRYNLSVPVGSLGYHGWNIKISGDGLTVLDGDPAVNGISGDAAVFVRASTALVGGMNQPQFEMRVRHVWPAVAGEALAVAAVLNADGTQIGLGGQQTKDSTGHKKRGEEGGGEAGQECECSIADCEPCCGMRVVRVARCGQLPMATTKSVRCTLDSGAPPVNHVHAGISVLQRRSRFLAHWARTVLPAAASKGIVLLDSSANGPASRLLVPLAATALPFAPHRMPLVCCVPLAPSASAPLRHKFVRWAVGVPQRD
jgi:hypothetical protein